MRSKSRSVNLTEGSIFKGLLIFSLPLMASNLFQQFYNTMDSLVVGQFVGSTALAAVGSTGSLSFLLIGFFMGFGTGSGVVIAQHYGARDSEGVSKSVHTAMALAIVFGIVLTGVLLLALQNYEAVFWLKHKHQISIVLSTVATIEFMITLQPYAAFFTFVFLAIKSLMLIKWR